MNKSYRDLLVWQKAMDLVVACYKITEYFPRREIYGLSSQLQRAAISIPANIAEGQRKEFQRYLSIAYGSLMEVETHLQISNRLGYLDSKFLHALLDKTSEIGRMINGLRASL